MPPIETNLTDLFHHVTVNSTNNELDSHIGNEQFIFKPKPFVALPIDRRTKYLQNRCSFMRGICTKKL